MYTGFANDKQETMSVSTAAGADAVRHMKGTLVKARKPPIFLKACRKFEPLFIKVYVPVSYKEYHYANIPLCNTMSLVNGNQNQI